MTRPVPPYQELRADGRELGQVVPGSDLTPTVCLACESPLATCGCSAAQRMRAAAIVHAELSAGRDPSAALAAWRSSQPAQSIAGAS